MYTSRTMSVSSTPRAASQLKRGTGSRRLTTASVARSSKEGEAAERYSRRRREGVSTVKRARPEVTLADADADGSYGSNSTRIGGILDGKKKRPSELLTVHQVLLYCMYPY